MVTLTEIEAIIEADPGSTGADFHKRLLKRLNQALENTGMDPDEIDRMNLEFSSKKRLMDGTFSDTYEPQIEEMEDHLCLSVDYKIPSHRSGFLGALNRFVKRLVMMIKLKADVQVSQQAKFNLASLVSFQLTRSHLDFITSFLEGVNERVDREKADQAEKMAALKKEIAELKERLDER